ncbi:unnamed protein product [Rotaria magnacalcarata]|uniref:Uncharacterized protein n=2 Tax=Rotaria magnacalcarata TaxID=392030 RepID=A0A819GFU5_9BILA|nr:unnamed protein product [Rotaria magnacalcarata]CAF1660600.1 unnamed protein product [Rotaria magnacalcarata]CAF2067217.1 unnamed protein product [Rotaria magnacalcarata]CAF2089234.1 unnamed protein product [Rotaria magnacalcarata]CAF2131010.1 unnamed protein product [Rotaria magnacalcarata]
MNEEDNFSNVQRLNSVVMAKYEWASSRMGMQKTGEEVHDRRSKTYRKANEFLQGLLQKRSDGSSLDDNGTIDRYRKFVKYKTNFNHDDNTLDEFDRRLRSLNQNNRRNQISTLKKSKNMTESITTDSQTTTTTEIENNTNELIQYLNHGKQLKPFTNTSSTNTTDRSVSSTIFFDDSEINISLTTEEHQSSSGHSSISSSNHFIRKTLYKPIARRADGSEITVDSTKSSLQSTSTNGFIFQRCHFPRSLLSREQVNANTTIKRQLPSPPIQQFDRSQLFYLLDRLDNENSPSDFTVILGQLTLSAVHINKTDDNISLVSDNDYEDQETSFIIPNLFDQSTPLPDYYKISTYHVDDPKNLSLYTMTIGTVQLSPSHLIPYSILNGRRPLLKSSVGTDFKKVRSKRHKHTCQVTAIESLIDTEYLKENDIILKINYQGVYHLPTDAIRDILQQSSENSNDCLLTIARLCQPCL